MRERAGVGNNAAGRNRAVLQRPDEFFIPLPLFFRARFNRGQGFGHARKSGADIRVQRLAALRFKAIFFIPNVVRCGL